MTDDATEWVTVKVPAADRDAAKDARPTGATHGDCLVAGARALAGDGAPGAGAGVLADTNTEREAVETLTREVEARVAAGEDVDADAIAERLVERYDLAPRVVERLDYAALADTLAERLEARLR